MVGGEEQCDEECQHQEVLQAEEPLVDVHDGPAAAQHEEEHHSKEGQETDADPEDG